MDSDSDRIKELEFLSGVTLRLEGEINLLKSWIKSQFEWHQHSQIQNQNQNQQNHLLLIPVVNTFSVTNSTNMSFNSQETSISQDNNNNGGNGNKYSGSGQSFILKSLLNKGKSEPIKIQPKPAAKLPNEYDTDDTVEIVCDTRSDKSIEMEMANTDISSTNTTTGSQVISFGDKNSNSSLINQPIIFTQTLMTVPDTFPDTDPLANCHQNESSLTSHTTTTVNVQTKPKKPKTTKNISILKNPINLSLTLHDKPTGTGKVRGSGIKTNVQENNKLVKKAANYKCINCTKTFCTFSKRARHIKLCQRTTLTHLPFKCEKPGCNMYFKKLDTLQKHDQVDHVGLKCQFCPEIMYSCRLLYRHVENVHFICGIKDCYKKFLTKIGLALHKKRKHPNKRNHFVHFKSQFIGSEKITTTTTTTTST